MSDSTSNNSRKLIELKECPSCKEFLEISEFIVSAGTIPCQWTHCSECREKVPCYELDYSITKQSSDYNVPFKPTYSKITISDGEPELSNSLTVTWDRIRNLNNKQLKSQKRNRVKSRKNKLHPWKYTNKSKTPFEENERRRFEKCWYSGNDEAIPTVLLEGAEWNVYWLKKSPNPPYDLPWKYTNNPMTECERHARRMYESLWTNRRTKSIPTLLLKKNALWNDYWNSSLDYFD